MRPFKPPPSAATSARRGGAERINASSTKNIAAGAALSLMPTAAPNRAAPANHPAALGCANSTAPNINSPTDIEGTYTQASASAAFGPGGKVIQMQNEKGVVLNLTGFAAGFEASLDLGGLTIRLK